MVALISPQEVSSFMGLKRDLSRALQRNATNGTSYVNVGVRSAYYSIGDRVLLWDDSNPVGEFKIVSSINGTNIILTSITTNAYKTLKNAKLQNWSHFTPRSEPSKEEVETLIENNEDVIYRDIHTNYASGGELYTEKITPSIEGNTHMPYLSHPARYTYDTHTPIQFKRDPVVPLDYTNGDHIYLKLGGAWKDALDPKNKWLMWDDKIDTIVNSISLAPATPISATITDTRPHLPDFLRYKLSDQNLTSWTLQINGTDYEGTTRNESFHNSDGLEGVSTYAYRFVRSVTFTKVNGNGTNDTLLIDTFHGKSRTEGDYTFWMDNLRGVFYPKSKFIDRDKFTIEATYHFGMYAFSNSTVPKDVKKMCILKTGIDLLGNERYAMNLPGGEGPNSQINLGAQVEKWERQYNKLAMKRREFVGGTPYA